MRHSNYLTFVLAVFVVFAGAEILELDTAEAKSKRKKVYAQKKKSSKKRGNKVREKTLVREKTYKGAKRNIDFDKIDIVGERKTPLGDLLSQKRANKEFDLIPIRYKWHDEMIKSTTSLETGRSK